MKGKRKFLLTLAGLVVFLVVKIHSPETDAFNLGMAIALLITPMSMANVMEHRAESGK